MEFSRSDTEMGRLPLLQEIFWTQDSCIAGGFFTSWATREAHIYVAAAKSLQSCPTLCDPIDRSQLGSSVPGIPQARTLEWVAISFSNAWKWKVKVKLLSCAWLLATPWTAVYQAPLPMGFSRQEYWSRVSLPSPIYMLETFKLITKLFNLIYFMLRL